MSQPPDLSRHRTARRRALPPAVHPVLEAMESRLLMCVLHEPGGAAFGMALFAQSVTGAVYGPTAPAATSSSSSSAPRLTVPVSAPQVVSASAVAAATVAQPAAPADDLFNPTTWATAANGLPILNSLPNAPTAIYLDFDGDGSNTPYSEDADATTYNPTEQANIVEAWRQISAYFAMFDTNVTTAFTSLPKAWEVIGNNAGGATGGYAFVGTFPNTSPQAFNTSGNARTRESGMAHEIGHVFGLWHQSSYDALGNKIDEYISAPDSLHGPIMGVDYSGTVHKWFAGHSSSSVGSMQDDIAIIASKIKSREPVGGDGFRPDDFGGTIATAGVTLDDGSGVQHASGIVERMNDVDAFSFVAGGGSMSISVVPDAPSGLDARLEIYDASGNRLAAKDGATNDQQLTMDLPAGVYYAMVSSHGDYGDLGEYDLSVRGLPQGWTQADVGTTGLAGYTGYSATAGLFTNTGSGTDVIGTTDQFHFAYRTLTGDGQIIARITQNQNIAASARAGLEIRDTLADNARHAAIVLTPAGSAEMISRTSAGGTAVTSSGSAGSIPRWLKLMRAGSVITGYVSSDGVVWTQVAQVTLGLGSTAYIGLLTTSGSTSKSNLAKFESVSVTGDTSAAGATYNALPGPTGLFVSPTGTGTGLALAWDDVPASTGFVVQRSSDGVNFTQVGTTTVGVTSYTDANPGAWMRYFYRVAAKDASGTSVASDAASAVNRAAPVTGLSTIAWSTTSLIVNWKDVSGDTGYRLERSSDGGATFSTIATVPANIPTYTDIGLSVGTAYTYRVVTLSAAGESAPSANVVGGTRLNTVTGAAIDATTPTAVTLHWTDLPNETNYQIQRSTDATNWTTVANVGADVTTYTDPGASPLTEYYYRVYGTTAASISMDATPVYTATPPATALPGPWAAADIGTKFGGGGTGASGYAGGTFTLIAGGSDIFGTADSFRYTYQPLVGNGDIVARVASIENTNDSAKVAVMIRASLSAGAQNVAVVLTKNAGIQLQTRSSTNGSTVATTVTGIAAPYWVRLNRVFNASTSQYAVTGYYSPDGVTWTQLGSTVNLNMPASAFIGLGTTSHDTTKLMSASVTDVTVANNAPTVQTAAAATSNPVINSDKATLSVLGADDHGESNLTYAWTTTASPAAVTAPTFGANNSNAAKSSLVTFFAPGVYQFTVTITDASGQSVTSAVSVTVAESAFPTVTNIGYDFRQTLTFTFNTDVGASLVPGDLQVTPQPTGTPLTPDGVVWNATTRTATFTFNTPLPNGNYRATLAAAGVATPGARHISADGTYDFFVLPGDANRDRLVNFDDLLTLARNYNTASGRTWQQGDFDGNGAVNYDDLLILARAYNSAVAAPPVPPPAPAPLALAAPSSAVVDVLSSGAAKKSTSVFNSTVPIRPTPAPHKPIRPTRPAGRGK